jgi:hypothetical protein
LIGQVRRDGEPYPANPDWHDCAFNGDLPPTKEADGMKESYQREEYCSDQRKASLRHFQPPKNLGSNFKARSTSRGDFKLHHYHIFKSPLQVA